MAFEHLSNISAEERQAAKEAAQKETAKSDYALLLRGHAVYQYFRMELFFYQLNADCSSCQPDDFCSEWCT